MSDLILSSFVDIFQQSLKPIAPFTWLGLSISGLDLLATIRLCVALRQIREDIAAKQPKASSAKKTKIEFDQKSFVKDLSTTLTVVYGGEVMTSSLLGLTPSFMASGVVPALYAGVQALVETLPVVPAPSLGLELPLAVVDGFTRAYLLCNLIPPAVTTHASPVLAASPWTLLLTSLITANGGFFLTNMFSFLHPTPLTLTTPPELRPYGWTTTDLWCAPLITGLFALLTHAQPFWANLHLTIIGLLGGYLGDTQSKFAFTPEALDPETARAVCAVILAGMFSTRAVKNFAGPLVFKVPTEVKETVKASASSASLSEKQFTGSTRSKAGKSKVQ